MFTGIISATGSIAAVEPAGEDRRLTVAGGKLDLGDVDIGDSICVSGVCLTVTEREADRFRSDVSRETLSCTTLGGLTVGDRVNLEKALRLDERLGGHLVSGHVDGIGRIREVAGVGASLRFVIEAPAELKRYICRKGSICVDGVSLTVNDVADDSFSVNIIPHTLAETTIADYREGSRVNLEVDIIARYLERLQAADA
jgi:riboflavin synthase